MGSVAKKLNRQLYDAIRRSGADLVASLMKRAPDRGDLDTGPQRYRKRQAGMLTVRAARLELSDTEEVWVFGADKAGLPMDAEEKHAVDAAALSAARKSAVESETPILQGPEAMRGKLTGPEVHAVVYAWRISDPAALVTFGELRHLTRLYWRSVAGEDR